MDSAPEEGSNANDGDAQSAAQAAAQSKSNAKSDAEKEQQRTEEERQNSRLALNKFGRRRFMEAVCRFAASVRDDRRS